MAAKYQDMLTVRIHRVHFVGIGGIGMSGIAEVLLNKGFEVSGSDIRDSQALRRLELFGAQVAVGHDAKNLGDADVLIYSSVIDERNPEIREARKLGIPIIPRAEMLAELMRMKEGIAIAGSHGKTTTTSLVAWIFSEAGLDPTCLVGGRLASFDSNARLGESRFLVAEADESDGSFLKLTPVLTTITNIDPEHIDHYKTFDNLIDAFVRFANCVPFYGMNVLCIDHPVIRDSLDRITRRYTTYGFSEDADYRAVNLRPLGIETRFDVIHDKRKLGECVVPLPGNHNVQNALAAMVCALEIEIPFETAAKALADFKGIDRRFQLRGEVDGVRVIDDYGHHPEEIRATLKAAKKVAEGKVFALFQPHRYSRVRDLFRDFSRSFSDADVLYVTEIYAASEAPIPEISGKALFDAITESGHPNVRFFSDMQQASASAADELKPGDMFLTLGAGDVKRACDYVLKELKTREDEKA